MDYKVHFKDDSSSLSHYGVKGQKWGIRRYQNEDGSLTPEGRKKLDQYVYSVGMMKRFQNNYSQGVRGNIFEYASYDDYRKRAEKIVKKLEKEKVSIMSEYTVYNGKVYLVGAFNDGRKMSEKSANSKIGIQV